MTNERIIQIFDANTANGCRELNEVRFLQIVREVLNEELTRIIKNVRESNPYPVALYPEPKQEDWKGIKDFLNKHGKNSDQIFAKYGRMVFEHCIERMEELIISEIWHQAIETSDIEAINQSLLLSNDNGSLPLETKLEMFYDFLYERGIANQLGVGIDTVVKHFIDEKLSGNDR